MNPPEPNEACARLRKPIRNKASAVIEDDEAASFYRKYGFIGLPEDGREALFSDEDSCQVVYRLRHLQK